MLLILFSLAHLLIMAFAGAVSTPTYDTMASAHQEVLRKADSESAITEFIFMVEGDIHGVVDLQKTDGLISWSQYRVTRQDNIWKDWAPASCVYSNEFSSLPFTVATTQVGLLPSTLHSEFNTEFGKKVAIYTNYMRPENSASSQPEVRTYSVPAYSHGQMWQQQLVVRQFQQHRLCEKKQNGSVQCGSWSEEVQGELPVEKGVIFGWRTAWEKLDVKDCGGGLQPKKLT